MGVNLDAGLSTLSGGGGEVFFYGHKLERYPNDLLVREIELLRSVVRKVRETRPFHIDAWGKEEKGREEKGARNHYEPQQAKKSDDGVSRIC